jgi:large subunit ribosomal protein L20
LALVKQGQHAYQGRKEKKREFKQLWIERLSALVQEKGSKYSVFMGEMTKKNILINKKILSNIGIAFPEVFDKIYAEVTK